MSTPTLLTLRDIRHSDTLPAMQRKQITELSEMWIAARSYRPQSARQRRSVIAGFVAEVGDKRPGDLDAQDLLRWWASTERLQPSTRRSYHAAVKGFLAWCRACGVDAPATMEEIRRPALPRTIPKVLSPAEELRLREYVEGTDLELAVALMLDMGLRRSEVVGARGEDIIDGWMQIHGKGGNLDRVPVAESVTRLAPPKGRLWPHTSGWLAQRTVAAMEACGIYGRTCHALRRTFATRRVEAGASVVDVMRLLRHQSLMTTTAYLASQFDRAA